MPFDPRVGLSDKPLTHKTLGEEAKSALKVPDLSDLRAKRRHQERIHSVSLQSAKSAAASSAGCYATRRVPLLAGRRPGSRMGPIT
jgi:hypothetical protein